MPADSLPPPSYDELAARVAELTGLLEQALVRVAELEAGGLREPRPARRHPATHPGYASAGSGATPPMSGTPGLPIRAPGTTRATRGATVQYAEHGC